MPGGKHQSVIRSDRRLRGVGARRMLKAIVEGKRDAGWMADYARGALRSKRRELKSALEGSFTNNQRWLLDKELSQLEWLEAQLQVLEQEIERRVEPFEQAIRHLITIPGVERKAAWTVVAEVGADMSVFADSRHLASWAGLCPGNRESGGKRISGRTRKANRYVRRALCQAAWAASHTRNTLISALYRRIQVRKGAPKAVMAVAHHLRDSLHASARRRLYRVGRRLLRPEEQTTRGFAAAVEVIEAGLLRRTQTDQSGTGAVSASGGVQRNHSCCRN
jgi:transposase